MSGTEETYHMTKEDIRKPQSATSKAHDGNIPKSSDAAMLQSIIDKAEKDKPTIIAERQANLPLPDDPPGPSDFNSADQRTVNVGSGGVATGDMSAGGREGKDGLDGLPDDAAARGQKGKEGLADTTNQ